MGNFFLPFSIQNMRSMPPSLVLKHTLDNDDDETSKARQHYVAKTIVAEAGAHMRSNISVWYRRRSPTMEKDGEKHA